MDKRLRELERKWEISGSDDDAGTYLRALARIRNYNAMSKVICPARFLQVFRKAGLESATATYLNWYLQTFRNTMMKLQTRSMRRRKIMDDLISKKGYYDIYWNGQLRLRWKVLAESLHYNSSLTTHFFNSVASAINSPWRDSARISYPTRCGDHYVDVEFY